MRAKVRFNTPAEEAAIQRGIAQDPDAQEADAAWFAGARLATEVLPPDVDPTPVRRRGPGKRPAKVVVSVRVPPDVAAALRNLGPDWGARAGDALAKLAKRGVR